MRITGGVLYMREQTARLLFGATPAHPRALMSDTPLFSARQLYPVLIDGARDGLVPEQRFKRWERHLKGTMS